MPQFIYPRDYFQSVEGREEQGNCFVLMPFDPKYRGVYDGVIKPTVEAAGLTCLRADDIYAPGPILVSIMEQIGLANVIIADLSDRNPNVFYELGMTHVRKSSEQVILITQSVEDVPFDLRHLRLIQYESDDDGAHKLQTDLAKALEAIGFGVAERLPEGIAEAGVAKETELVSGGDSEPQPYIPAYPAVAVPRGSPDLFKPDTVLATSIFFSLPDETDDLAGQIVGNLMSWFNYEQVKASEGRVDFPGGSVQIFEKWVEPTKAILHVEPSAEVGADDLARAVGPGYSSVEYLIMRSTSAGDLVAHLKLGDLTITFATDRQVTTRVGAYNPAYIDLTPGDATNIALRARERLGFTIGSVGVVPFDLLALILDGRLRGDDLDRVLEGYYQGGPVSVRQLWEPLLEETA